MMTPALVSVPSFDVLTEPKKYFLLPSLFPVLEHLAVDLKELSIFSVFILVPAIPVVYFCFFLLLDDFLVLPDSLVWSEVVVVFGISEEISGH